MQPSLKSTSGVQRDNEPSRFHEEEKWRCLNHDFDEKGIPQQKEQQQQQQKNRLNAQRKYTS